MTSRFDTLFASHAKPVALAHLGETDVLHYPRGNTAADGMAVDAIFTEEEAQDGVRRGRLEVLDTLTLSNDDAWLIKGNTWLTDDLKGVGPASGGFIRVAVRLKDQTLARPA